MKILTFLARHFRWKAWSQTLEHADDATEADGSEDVVVAFIHADGMDFTTEESEARVFKHALKHLKWMANKKDFRRVVLHSFTHLGAANAAPEPARDFLNRLADRLRATGYEVKLTPFGWFCEWELSVYGESLAKVWKDI